MTLLFQKKVVTVCHRMLQTILERLLIGSESRCQAQAAQR